MADRHGNAEDSFLFLCDSWSPVHGGIPAFNRMLAIGMAATGRRSGCVVQNATAEEIEDARARGVFLFPSPPTPNGPDLRFPSSDAVDFAADVVVGNDRFSGTAAWMFRRTYAPRSALVHIVHTASAPAGRFKEAHTIWTTEERERINRAIAADAEVVAAVGPLLRRHTEDLIANGTGTPRAVTELIPGLERYWDQAPEQTELRRVPARQHVLVLGRTRSLELKGLDLAALAVAALPEAAAGEPALLVRGAPAAECDVLHRKLTELSKLARDRVDVRSFTVDPAELHRELARAALCVMPSRFEGFGLAAFDAIATGTPVLVSSRSGAAELLIAELGRMAEPMIVPVVDNLSIDVRRWSGAIEQVLVDLPRSFAYAAMVRDKLVKRLSWRSTATQLVEAAYQAQTRGASQAALL